MAQLKILICGGGIAGPALAYWLSRSNQEVTICERFPTLRAAGAQIDLRAQGIEVVKRMGLLPAIREKLVDEAGVSLVDSNGNIKATIMANKTGKGAQGPTSEYEIMRGDLVRIFYDATKDKVEYKFNKTVERFEQDEEKVLVYFSDGSTDTYDLLKAILPPNSPDPVHRLGLGIAYYFIPRIPTDHNIRRSYHSPGSRLIMRRSHNPTETQVYLFLRSDSLDLETIPKAHISQQKDFWTQRFHDAGWQADRFMEGMKTTENFYCQDVVQIRISTWHKNRVVLLGDAACCPSPLTGMGTTAGLVGAYVLAGEINNRTADLRRAFERYDKVLRPFVDEVQRLNPWFLSVFIPKTGWGIAILHFLVGLLCFLRVPELIARFSGEDKGGWRLPDYRSLRSFS